MKISPLLAEALRRLRDRLWSWSGPDRRLYVEVPGRWYLLLCIALGVTAVLSGNNVLLLLESLLLGGLILSGILSEWTVARVQITLRRGPAYAGESAQDKAIVKSRSFLPLFCIEVGEWRNGHFLAQGFIPLLMPGQTLSVAVKPRYERRGEVSWEAWGVATAFPFGLARKVRITEDEGRRLVWPARRRITGRVARSIDGRDRGERQGKVRELEVSADEVRPWTWSDDVRDLVWTKRLPHGERVSRVRRLKSGADEQLRLDLDVEPGTAFEARLSTLSARITTAGPAVQLSLRGSTGTRVVRGRKAALDALAVAQAQKVLS